MKRMLIALLAAPLLALPQPALAGAANFVLVNGTGAPVTNVAIRRATTNSWTAIPAAPASGARANVQFSDPDCAFDIRANLAGIGDVIWTGVNLCGMKAVILNRNGAGVLWVDYE
ncbi:MAG TPA: hypothetical protein VFZ35_02850 [Sphingomicrobium sp.]